VSSSLLPRPPRVPHCLPLEATSHLTFMVGGVECPVAPPPPPLAPPADSLPTPVAEIGSGGDCSDRPSFAAVACTPLGWLARTPRGFQNPSSHLPLPPLRRLVASAASRPPPRLFFGRCPDPVPVVIVPATCAPVPAPPPAPHLPSMRVRARENPLFSTALSRAPHLKSSTSAGATCHPLRLLPRCHSPILSCTLSAPAAT
jgi:hypothetical protein